MPESSDRPVIVTAEERAHPALRKLARACLALARHRRESATPPETATTADDRSGSGEETEQ
jgi:hypothetical protein